MRELVTYGLISTAAALIYRAGSLLIWEIALWLP